MTSDSPASTGSIRLGRPDVAAGPGPGRLVGAALAAPRRAVDTVRRRHHPGDVDRRHLTEIGGTGVFVGAVREALRGGTIDVAVHSLKDLPTAPSRGSRDRRRARPARTPGTC